MDESDSARPLEPVGDAAPAVVSPPPAYGWRLHRRMYDWVLHWADTPYGAPALFILSFAESSFFPIPPDVLLIALVLGAPRKWFRFALICTAASTIGGIAGYGIGLGFMDTIGDRIIRFYHAEHYYEQVTKWYQQYDYWIVFIAALTPIPYKVFTIASGAFGMNLLGFTLVSIVGRGARFFAVSILLYWFGPPMKRLIDRYFDLFCVVFVVLLAGGFLAINLIR
ncbi:MAG TPA: YqaA family protein [Phycisphaerae bacterium]|nr:YqaA family protein [Phycisphaerae bacterium]